MNKTQKIFFSFIQCRCFMYSFHILKEAILLNTMNNFLSACVTGDRGYLKNFKTRVYAIYIEIWFVETFAPNDLNF